MKLTFLGTGTSQGIPVIACTCATCLSQDIHDKRLRTSALIEHEGTTIVIDAGPDFRQQMLRCGVKRLDSIILTHEHRDHMAGIDDVRAFNYVQQQPMDVWAEERVQHSLKTTLPYIFEKNKYPGVPDLELHTINGDPFYVNNLNIIPIRAYHLKMPVYGFRINQITYITDANFIPEEEKSKIKGTEYLIINALQKQKHISHFCLQEALEVVEEFKPKKAFITHVSHLMGLHKEVEKELPKNVFLAYDGLTIEL